MDVSLEQVWIDDTPSFAVAVEPGAGVSLSDVLIDSCGDAGVAVQEAHVDITRSEIRGCHEGAFGQAGFGVLAFRASASDPGADVSITSSVVRDSAAAGVLVSASRVHMAGSVVLGSERALQAQAIAGTPSDVELTASFIAAGEEANVAVNGSHASIRHTTINGGAGYGIFVGVSADMPGDLVLDQSRVSGSGQSGVFALDGTLAVSATLIEQTGGIGVLVQSTDGSRAAHGLVRTTRVAAAHMAGLFAQDADMIVEGVAVSDTLELDEWGIGVVIQASEGSANTVAGAIHDSAVERGHVAGVFLAGADASVLGLAVRDTPNTRGLVIQDAAGLSANVAVSHSLIEHAVDVGIFVGGSHADIDSVGVLGVKAHSGNLGGDGVVFIRRAPAGGTVVGSLIQGNARAGVGVFGADVVIRDTALTCNAIALNAERGDGVAPVLTNAGGNVCGCMDELEECRVLSTMLAPPDSSSSES